MNQTAQQKCDGVSSENKQSLIGANVTSINKDYKANFTTDKVSFAIQI